MLPSRLVDILFKKYPMKIHSSLDGDDIISDMMYARKAHGYRVLEC